MGVFVMMKTAIGTGLALAVVVGFGMNTARAADASHPYSNVDHAVDAGNNTGDSQVDQLNEQQLQKNAQPSQGGSSQGWAGNTGRAGYAGQPGYPAAYAGAPGYYPYQPYPAYAYAPSPVAAVAVVAAPVLGWPRVTTGAEACGIGGLDQFVTFAPIVSVTDWERHVP